MNELKSTMNLLEVAFNNAKS